MSQKEPDADPADSDFSHWRRELQAWESDISRWQADHQSAVVELARIEKLVLEHGAALREYATDLAAHRQRFDAFDREARPARPALDASKTLQELTLRHVRLREVHERIRRHHDHATAQLQALAAALDASF